MKKYCKYCKWYVSEWQGIQDVCGAVFETYTNEVGKVLLKTYGDVQKCELCGHIENDGREIRHQKCLNKNMDFKCKDFQPVWYRRLFRFKNDSKKASQNRDKK